MRDVYGVGDDAVLLVATDRISAFDVVLEEGIPDKGRVLTKLSAFWFKALADVIDNHLISVDDDDIADRLSARGVALSETLHELLRGRCMLCRRTKPLPIEAVVRGYLSGSGWKAYRDAGSTDMRPVDLWGVALPPHLRESSRLPSPIFTPSTKAEAGHDMPMHQADISSYVGAYASPVEIASLELYKQAARSAAKRGIIIADTKFEFGTISDPDGGDAKLLLIDEVLTPDSSRFWDASAYAPGGPQPSFDKQFVRDYLESVPGWNKQSPAPNLPRDVVEKTAEKYKEAYFRITGERL